MLLQFLSKQIIQCVVTSLLLGVLPCMVLANDNQADNSDTIKSDTEFKSLVPSLIGLTIPDVIALLPQYDLSLGVVTEEANTAKTGTVFAQSKASGSEVKRWTVIDVSVAIANKQKAIAKTKQQAQSSSLKTEDIVSQVPINEIFIPATEAQLTLEDKQKLSPIEKTPPKEAATSSKSKSSKETATTSTSKKRKTSYDSEDKHATDKATVQTPLISDDKKSTAHVKRSVKASQQYGSSRVTVSISPSDVQVSRDITMEIQVNPPIESNNLEYQFNISGKLYKRKSPVFTHVFSEEDKVMVTVSARIIGKTWLHSSSRWIEVGKYVPRKIKVPNIVGLSEKKAAALLKSKGLLVGNTQEKIIKGGSGIIKQMPAAGSIRTEDDNKIHYVKAIDEKFKLAILPPSHNIDTGKPAVISVKLTPKARSKKVRYRFVLNGKSYFSLSPQWKYTFTQAGKNTLVAEAIIAGEGTFSSPPISFSVTKGWSLPKAVISPFTVSVAQGESVTFKSNSSYDQRGKLQLTWHNEKTQLLNKNKFSIDTKDLSEGEHAVTLKIKDEKGHEDTVKAQLIITPKVKELSQAEKEQLARVEEEEKKAVLAELEKQAAEEAAKKAALVEAEKLLLAEEKAQEELKQQALAATEETNVLEQETLTSEATASETDTQEETIQLALTEASTDNGAAESSTETVETLDNAAVQPNTEAVETEASKLSTEQTEIIESITPENVNDTDTVEPATPIHVPTTGANTQLISAEAIQPNKMTVNIGIWLLTVVSILMAIFWVLRKSIKADKTTVKTVQQAEIPVSPYKKAKKQPKISAAKADKRFADLVLDSHKKTAKKSKNKSDLVDFNLGIQQGSKSKEDELINFKLDDKK